MKFLSWINRKDREMPEHNWYIIGFDVNDSIEPNFSWQIGRRIGDQIELWGHAQGGPFQGDSFWTWNPQESTHWIEFYPWEIKINYPALGKGQDYGMEKI